jgi:hypothetical protein
MRVVNRRSRIENRTQLALSHVSYSDHLSNRTNIGSLSSLHSTLAIPACRSLQEKLELLRIVIAIGDDDGILKVRNLCFNK